MTTVAPEKIRLTRTGEAPVEFAGELIRNFASSNVKFAEETAKRRQWFTAELYQTRGGKLVLHLHYRSNGFVRERPFDEVVVAKDKVQMLDAIDKLDIQEWIVGSPDVGYEEWDMKLRRHGDIQWEELAEELNQHLMSETPELVD